MQLKDFAFHDMLLKKIFIERSNPGYKDEIAFLIGSPKDEDFRITFKECIRADFKLNFGVIAEETIYDINEYENSEELESLKTKWEQVGGNLDGLRLFVLETNSTNSIILIYAENYEIERL